MSEELTEYKTTTGEVVKLPPREALYQQMIKRNHGIISAEEQGVIRKAKILVAGCGSIGGAIIEPLIRIGAENFILAEPDGYDFHNINRQSVRLQDVGINKAESFKRRLGDINPYVSITVHDDGITDTNVETLVMGADIIFDGVDVTNKPPILCKFALHKCAKKHKVPVISGYDIAGLQLLLVYDYRKENMPVFNAKVLENELETLEPMPFLQKIIPFTKLPFEIIEIMEFQYANPEAGFPQVVYTAVLYGAMALRTGIDVLMGRPVKHIISFDLNDAPRPLEEKIKIFFMRYIGLVKSLIKFKQVYKQT